MYYSFHKHFGLFMEENHNLVSVFHAILRSDDFLCTFVHAGRHFGVCVYSLCVYDKHLFMWVCAYMWCICVSAQVR